jgi:hypothetical protein
MNKEEEEGIKKNGEEECEERMRKKEVGRLGIEYINKE